MNIDRFYALLEVAAVSVGLFLALAVWWFLYRYFKGDD